jgi:hypothetical protein
VFKRFHLKSTSAVAREIAEEQFNELLHATGRSAIDDVSELYGIVITIVVKVTPDEGYGEQNEIVGYRPLNAATPASKPADTTAPVNDETPAKEGTDELDDDIPF